MKVTRGLMAILGRCLLGRANVNELIHKQRKQLGNFLVRLHPARRNVLRWLHAAKRQKTRTALISKIVELSSQSLKVPNL